MKRYLLFNDRRRIVEAAGSAPDERSGVFVNATRTCQAVLDDLGVLATLAITDGNIQVRP